MSTPRDSGIGGLRVLDFAGRQAWYGSKLLADLGADVIRIEPPAGDPLREEGPYFRGRPGPGRSLLYAFYNTSKRSLALDLDCEEGRSLFRRALAEADVVIESEPLGRLDELGIGYDSVKVQNSHLIWASVTPFGLKGPRSGWEANDLVAMAAGGVLFLNGYPDRPPINSPLEQAFNLGGIAAASGILMALRHRHQTGRGQRIDVSLQAAVATCTENVLGFWDVQNQVRRRQGVTTFNGSSILFECTPGWVAGMAGNRWEDLVVWAEEAGVAGPEWYEEALVDRESRAGRQAQANQLVKQLFLAQTKNQVADRAREIRIPIQPVNTLADLFEDTQLAYRAFWTGVSHEDLGSTITYPGAPFLSTNGFWRIRGRAPLPGEHTREVLSDIGLSTEETEVLIRKGVVAQLKSPFGTSNTAEPIPAGKRSRLHPVSALESDKPMAGVRVLDFSQAVTGPLAARILADHGAEVIKLEWGQRPDPQRAFPPRNPGITGPNVSALWNLVNASKLSGTINLNTEGGRALLYRLISISDIILDNYGQDPFPKWGIDYENARRIRPDIIMIRSSTTGRSGPRAGLAGLGYGIAASAGWNALMGFPGDPPIGMGPAFPDYSVNLHHMLVSLLVSLEHRRKTGQGQYIDLSQHESSITWLGPAILDYTVNGHILEPTGNRHPNFAPHGVYPAAGDERWIAIGAAPEKWESFKAVAAEDGVRFDEPEIQTHADRKANEDLLDEKVKAWTSGQDASRLTERLQAAGIAAYPLNDGSDLVVDPQLAARHHYRRLAHPEAGERLWDHHAFRLSGAPGDPRRSPLLGEHNDWLFGELLGLDDEEVAMAYVDSVIN